MSSSERHTISRIRRMLQAAGLNPRHDLGQNFLIDLNLLDVIIAAAELTPDDVVLEVGTGTGSLTVQLAERAGHVVAVEYDPQMAKLTASALGGWVGVCDDPGLPRAGSSQSLRPSHPPQMARLTASALGGWVGVCDDPGSPQTGSSQSLRPSHPLPNVTLLNCDALRNKNHLADEVLAALASVLSPRPRFGGEGASASSGTAGREPEALARTTVSANLDSDPVIDQPPHPNPLPHGGEGTKPKTLKLVANLPYHVATPVISNLVATELPWSRMVVTIQLELAERMTAAPKTADYSALSVWLQAQCRIEILRKLPPSVFWPKPKVDSAIVRIDRDLERQSRIHDRAAFHDFLRDVFTQRRKHLLGVVARMMSDRIDRATLEAIHAEFGWPTTIRAEELSVDEFVAYHNKLV